MKNVLILMVLTLSFFGQSQNGIIWGPEITVSDGTQFGNLRPRAAIVGTDTPVVLYGKSGSENLFISRWNGAGFDLPISILPSNSSSYVANWTGPDIGSKGDTVIAVFKMNPLETGNVYAVRSIDGGVSFSDTIRVDSHDTGVAWMPSLEMDANGNPVIAIMIHGSNWSNPRYAMIHSNDAGITYTDEIEVTGSIPGEACDCCPAEVAVDGQRRMLLFRNNENNIRDIYGVLSTDNGASYSSFANLDNINWSIMACPSTGADAIFMGDNVYTAYASAGEGIYRVYLSKASASAGLTFDQREMVIEPVPSNGIQNFPTISGENDTIVMAWEEREGPNPEIYYSVSVPGLNPMNALTQYKNKANLSTTGTQTNPEIIYKNGIVHLFFQDDYTGNLIYRRGTIDVDAGINENEFEAGIYPNPSSGAFIVSSPIEIQSIQISDSYGRKVSFRQTKTNENVHIYIPRGKGLYFITLTSHDSRTITRKYIIE